MNSKDLRGLCGAYGEIYEDGFEIWVNSLIDEGYDLSDYTWEEMYEEYILEYGPNAGLGYARSPKEIIDRARNQTQERIDRARNQRAQLGVVLSGGKYIAKPGATSYDNERGSTAIQLANRLNKEEGRGKKPPENPRKPSSPERSGQGGRNPSGGSPPTSGGNVISARNISRERKFNSSSTTTSSPSSPASTRTTPLWAAGGSSSSSGVLKPKTSTPPAGGQTGDKAKDMQTWAKANPTLANKPQRTFNPLMQKTFGYQSGYSPNEVKSNIQKFKTLAGAGLMNNNYSWGSSSKLVDDIAYAYQLVYEAKKIDQDYDGDNDFADIRIARMIASGVPKEVAIAKVRGKSYNEEYEIYEETAEEKEARIAARRARVKEMQAQGRVMTSSKRASARAKERREEQRAEKLEKLANQALEATRGATRRSSAPMGTTPPSPKPAAPSGEGVRRLPTGAKVDPLDKLLKQTRRGSTTSKKKPSLDDLLSQIQKEDFNFWIDELLDEGCDLSDYTLDEMVEIYLDEAMIEGPRKERMRQKQHGGYLSPRDKAHAFNIGTRNDTGPSYQKASTGGKGKRYPGYGDRGTGNKSRRRMGLEPLRGNTRKVDEDFILWIDELLDEGYELDNWTDEELYDLYEEIIEEKYTR